MSQRIKRAVKAASFMIIAFLILVVCNFITQPVWNSEGNRVYGFYDEPTNTIETLFLGSSQVHYGVSPMEMYQKYGICAYDLSTPAQPMLASYYWLEEAYSYHKESLDTVVLDVSELTQVLDTSWYHEAIDPMNYSLAKLHAVKDYSNNFEDFLQNLMPLFSYHERWKELSETDFLKYTFEPDMLFRGYYYRDSQIVTSVNDVSDIYLPLLILNENNEDYNLVYEAVQYFNRIVSFCKSHNIQLVLIKTPSVWSSEKHNAIQKLADSNDIYFIDFNLETYYNEIGYDLATDSGDAKVTSTYIHANYYGAMKLSDYLGRYLVEECGNKDIRGDDRYAFMEEELSEYNQYVSFRQSLLNATDPCDYIKAALNDWDCTIFISVKDDASSSLTEEQREYFNSVGLNELSQLTYGCSYLAVIDNGKVITEQYQLDPGEGNETNDLISYSGTLHNGTVYSVVSGGYHMGNKSSIIIDDTECSNNQRGLNIAIYDNQLQRYVTNANFDTYASPGRDVPFNEQNYEALIEEGTPFSSLTGTDRIMYLYNRECENEKTAKLARLEMNAEGGLITYLKAFWDDEDIDIFISTQGDASEILTDTVRANLSEMGLVELSQLFDKDSYVAAISGGKIEFEEGEYSENSLEVSTDQYTIRSTGREKSDDKSSVIINGTEYSPEENGIFIVIYDNITEMAVDTVTFEPRANNADEAEEAAG